MQARFTEPSTYAGLGLIALALARIFFPEYSQVTEVFVSALCTAAGGAAVLLPEKGGSRGE